MGKGVLLSEADAERVQDLLTWYERNRVNLEQPPRRRPASGGGDFRKAYAKTGVGAGAVIVCYLDEHLNGDEVDVYFELLGGITSTVSGHLSIAAGSGLWVGYNTVAERWEHVSPVEIATAECE
jgi:hypothetical protein